MLINNKYNLTLNNIRSRKLTSLKSFYPGKTFTSATIKFSFTICFATISNKACKEFLPLLHLAPEKTVGHKLKVD